MVLAVAVNASLLVASLHIWGIPVPGGLMASILPVLAGAAYAVAATVRVGQAGSRVPQPPERPTGLVHRDDDRYWLGGAVYIHRGDPALFVQRRFGVGWTVNLGHPVSWLVLIALRPLLTVLH